MLREKAVNYNQVNNIEFSIKKLDMAFNADKVKKKMCIRDRNYSID